MTAKRTVPEPDPEQDYRSAMRDAIGMHWAAAWKAMPAVLAGEDPKAVHTVRVASRRLRAAMDVAGDCFPTKWYRPLHKTAKRMTRNLGAVRERDVMLEALARDRERASDPERRAINYLIAAVKRDRKKARKAMITFVAKLDAEGVRKETKRRFPRPKGVRAVTGDSPGANQKKGAERGQTGEDGPHDDGGASMGRRLAMPAHEASLETNARRVLAVRVDKLFDYAPIIPDAEASEALHDARIATKRLRYTLELFRSVFEEDGERAVDHLKALQEALGELHDHDVRIAVIDEELSALDNDGDQEASELQAGFEALLRRERKARATCHTAVVKQWRRLEDDQVQARLRALPAEPGIPTHSAH